MATSIFDNREIVPIDEDLEEVLKSNYNSFKKLITFLEKEYGELKKEWKFYSKKAGWTLRISNEKRNLVFISPNDEHFFVTVNMSVKISKIALDSNISENTKDLIKQTKSYAEGKSVLIPVKKVDDLEDIKVLLDLRDN